MYVSLATILGADKYK